VKILAVEREKAGVQSEDFQPVLKEEARHAWELYRQGVFRELYFDDRRHTAVIMMECENVNAAREVLGRLPLVRAGLIEFEIIPLRAYDGFERLFG
jgi:hypothetical protein